MPISERDVENLTGRVGELERSAKTSIDAVNKVFQHAKDYDSGLTKRLDGIDQRLDNTVKQLNQVLQHAKDYDSGLTKRLTSVEQELKARGSESPLTKTQASALINVGDTANKGLISSLERELNNQINNLKKQVDTLAKNNKR